MKRYKLVLQNNVTSMDMMFDERDEAIDMARTLSRLFSTQVTVTVWDLHGLGDVAKFKGVL